MRGLDSGRFCENTTAKNGAAGRTERRTKQTAISGQGLLINDLNVAGRLSPSSAAMACRGRYSKGGYKTQGLCLALPATDCHHWTQSACCPMRAAIWQCEAQARGRRLPVAPCPAIAGVQPAAMPSSAVTTAPLMNPEASEAINSNRPSRSSGLPTRRRGSMLTSFCPPSVAK